jgi:hypothetical protein
MKIDLVLENPNELQPNKVSTYQKNKFRCSLKGIWDIDLTILLIEDCKTKQYGIYFEIEIEFNYKYFISKKIEQNHVLDEFTQISNSIITTINCARNNTLDIELRYSVFNQVVTLERQYLPKLLHGNYSVTEKADGERVFIYIDSKKNIYRMNPTNVIPNKILLLKSVNSLKISNTVIDGELIEIKGKQIFLGFDVLFFNEKDCRNYNLIERLKYLKSTIIELNKTKVDIIFKNKVFYTKDVFANAHKIWINRKKLFPYHLDGLIFTPIRGAYLGNLPNYKWKDKHSIDVRIMYNSKFNFTEFHPFAMPYTRKGDSHIANEYVDRQTGNVYYTRRMSTNNPLHKQMKLVSDAGYLGVAGKLSNAEHLKNMVDIVEIEWEPDRNEWVFLRTRPDKERQNASKTIISVLDAIVDNISIVEISKMKHKKSPYELVDAKECYNDTGINITASDISSNICKFYTWVYENIMPVGNTILLLGCDMCVLRAAIKNYKNILVLEPNCLEVFSEEKSEGYVGLKEFAKKINSNATIVWGGCDISTGIKSFNKTGQSEINIFMKKNSIDTVFINSFQTIFYKNGKFDKPMFEKNIKQLKSISKQIIGMYLNGTQIIKHLETQDCLLTKNNNLHPMYRIYLNNRNLSKYKCDDIFKINTNIKHIEIHRMQSSFTPQQHPLIFDKNIQDIVKNSGCKISECKSLNSFYTQYKKGGGVLSEYDRIILNITKYIKI